MEPHCGRVAFKELTPRAFRFSQLRGGFFFDWHESIAELLRLPFEFRFEPFLTCGVALGPKLSSYSTCFFTIV
jgi:hypothetical protein